MNLNLQKQAQAAGLGKLADFKNFLYVFFTGFLGLPSPTPVQYDIADYLQYGPKSRIIMAFRGVGKSYITVAFVCWLFLVDPNFKILVVSASEDKAKDFANLVKQAIDNMPGLAHLKPGRGQRDSVLSFDVGPAKPAKDPSLNVKGITGQITGGRADFVVADDVETPDNSATAVQREKLANKVKEFSAIIGDKKEGQIIYLGTPQTEQSLYMDLASHNGFEIRIWPSRYPSQPERYVGRLAPKIMVQLEQSPNLTETPTDPLRFDDETLKRKMIEYGPTGFRMQFQLDPSLADEERYPLKLRDFIVMSVNQQVGPVSVAYGSGNQNLIKDPTLPVVGFNGDRWNSPAFVSTEFLPYDLKIMAIDPSGRGSNETAYVVLYVLKGYVYIAEWGGVNAGYDDSTLVALANIAKKHGVQKIAPEDNFGDGMFRKLFQPVLTKIHPQCSILEDVYSTRQKEKRICDTIEPVLGAHRLVIDEAVIRNDYKAKQELQALYQLTRMTRDRGAVKKDDRIDVLAIGLAQVADMLALDTTVTEDQYRAQLKEENLERFIRNYTGRMPQNGASNAVWSNLNGCGDDLELEPDWEPVERKWYMGG